MTSDELRQAAKIAKARKTLLDFTTYTFPGYQINWHHRYLCDRLTAFAHGHVKRMMVFMPPRTGKSELVSRRLPAFLLGLNPNCRIITAGYASDIARASNRDVQRIIDDDSYRNIFPRTCLFGKHVRERGDNSFLRNTDEFEIVGHHGGYKSSGVGGGLTGRGFNFGIIDDPIKDREQADSAVYREKLWDWYRSVFYTRQEKDASILLTVTRWHHDDLAARILKNSEESGEPWEVISLPALREKESAPYDPREEGESLWPEKYPTKQYELMRMETGTRDWSSLYQQHPSPDAGSIFKREWFKYWRGQFEVDGEPPSSLESMIRYTTIDLAASKKEHADYTVIAVWGVAPGRRLFLLDMHHERLGGDRIQPVMRSIGERWNVTAHWVEKVGFQLAIIQQCVAGGLPVREYVPSGDKVARAYAASPPMEAGRVLFPREAPWLSSFEDEVLSFPLAKHDDYVDALTSGVAVYQKFMYASHVPSAVAVTASERQSFSSGIESGKPKKRGRHDRPNATRQQW